MFCKYFALTSKRFINEICALKAKKDLRAYCAKLLFEKKLPSLKKNLPPVHKVFLEKFSPD
jgi:hypothetical protein